MLEVADVFRRYGDAYLQRHGASMLPSHRRALDDIRQCRTEALGGHVYDCAACGHRRYAYHSCKNRSCPKCQGDETAIWLEQRRRELLAVPYFHLVFTLPQELHGLVRSQQKTMVGVLMKAAATSLMKLAADRRYVGGQVGILAVLHTWTQTLTYHPHVHLLVPAGGVSDDERWQAARKNYLVPVKALSLLFRGAFLDLARRALPHQPLPHSVWKKNWVVYCKPTVQGSERVLRYLGRYVHRTAMANSRLVGIEDGQVSFRYQNRRQRRRKVMTLPALEFIRRFLQHVLPRGTHKIRYYGLWHPCRRTLLRRIQMATAPPLAVGAVEEVEALQTDAKLDRSFAKPKSCPCCGGEIWLLVETITRPPRGPP